MRLYHNTMSLNVFRNYQKVLGKQAVAFNNITTGEKLNTAKDNPNGVSKSENMRLQIRSLQMLERNVQDGISMLQTANSGVDVITEHIERIRELTIQSGSVNREQEKKIIQDEINQMIAGIRTTVNGTEFNGNQLISFDEVTDNKKPKYKEMVSGVNVGEKVEIPMFNLSPEKLGNIGPGKSVATIDITKEGGKDEALNILDAAVETLTSVNAKYGALQNRLDSLYFGNSEIAEAVTRGFSSITDADIAEEAMNIAKYDILSQTSNAIMAQTNDLPKDILRVLEKVR